MFTSKLKYLFITAVFLSACSKKSENQATDPETTSYQFVFTSDSHYGLTRPAFQGAANVDAHIVNAAMVAKMNTLPDLTLPNDSGVNAGKKIGSVDYIFHGGDIANRMETSANVQLASKSWDQFNTDFLQNLTLKNSKGGKAQLFVVPGNHDVSNTIGYYATMSPLTDATSLTNIYNLMLNPAVPKTPATLNYSTDRVNYSKDLAGIHFCFIQMWPDSAVRVWMSKDLQTVANTTPVIIVAHDQPAVVSNHFTNPNGNFGINNTDKFDNVLDEHFKDGKVTTVTAAIEQRAFATFLKAHTNIKAYFHGHVHQSQYYTYTGPDNDLLLPTVGADSPMKGLQSMADETKLTFHFGAIDTKTMTMTIRECYWDSAPSSPSTPIKWGNKFTIKLK
jgi:hypothetical protein